MVNKAYLPERVLQFGEGNFLRAFVDWQIDEMNSHGLFNGSVVIVQPIEEGLTEKINQQDGLYTLILQGYENERLIKETKLIKSISRAVNPYQDLEAYINLAKQPEFKFIFSNTTEAGIVFNEQDDFNLQSLPKTFPGKLTAFLYERYKFFNGDLEKGLYIIPCELIERNADQLKTNVLKYIKLWDLSDDFRRWVEKANYFCCSLVDRIVPGYPKDQVDVIENELGYHDDLIVVGEHYHLWVIEADQHLKSLFPADRIGLNTLFVDDLDPYRLKKVHLLNGTHSAMTPVAYLLGLDTVEASVYHPHVKKFLECLIYEEVIPTLPYDHKEMETYAESVFERFKNPYIKHQLISISLNSIAKFASRNIPVLLRYVKQKDSLPKKLVFAFTALIFFYQGKRGEEKIELKDDKEVLLQFQELWTAFDHSTISVEELVLKVLSKKKWWGEDLTEIQGLGRLMTQYLTQITEQGFEKIFASILEGDAFE